jgi:hypothetical protein
MRQLAAVVFLGGCSFIFNPDHINRDIDAHVIVVDTEVIADVDITALKLEYAYPAIVYEGAGQANARASLVVIRGEQISPTATVTVVPATGSPAQITVNDIKIAGDSNWIAISISAPVDLNQDETGTKMASPVPLIVTVDNGGGNVRSLPPEALSLTFLDQLIAPIAAPVAATKLYSKIAITTADAFPSGSNLGRIELHSMSGISFSQLITLSATTTMVGPGGCGAGAIAASSAASSAGDMADCTQASGGGDGQGGQGGQYHGNPQLSSFAAATPGGGGGGGHTTLGLLGAVGGAGAGMLSLTAGGDLTIGAGITAIGGVGGNASVGDGAGGGGAGGTLLLRSGGTLSVTGTLTLTGGSTGTGGTPGEAGAVGHVRYDAAHGSAPSGYIGPMFQTVPYFSYDAQTQIGAITVTGTPGDTTSFGQAYDKDLNPPGDGGFDLSFNIQGVATPHVMLSPGYNKICATVPSGNLLDPDSGNCAEIAYLPGPHP